MSSRNRRTEETLTVENILRGTSFGNTQSVGQMQVVPILDESGDASDDHYAAPNLNVRTSNYGTVDVRNEDEERETIIPTGAGWVTKQHAQDHAIPSAHVVKPKSTESIDTAMCIEESQSGLIQGATDFLIIPATLRVKALSKRHDQNYSKLWSDIGKFNRSLDVSNGTGHLVRFLKQYERELDEFVAEFEIVPNQIGAIVLIAGKIVGIERAPNFPFWEKIWTPLIRVCYGSLAIQAHKLLGTTQPSTRSSIVMLEKSLDGLKAALDYAHMHSQQLVMNEFNKAKQLPLKQKVDSAMPSGASLITIANQFLAGQIITREERIPYASICAAGA